MTCEIQMNPITVQQLTLEYINHCIMIIYIEVLGESMYVKLVYRLPEFRIDHSELKN